MQQYGELQFRPEKGNVHHWHVWCKSGALQVLQTREFVQLLSEKPDSGYTINFANGSAARIWPGAPLWESLVEISKTYTVKVFGLGLRDTYETWTGGKGDRKEFDAILIENKK